jgi:malonate-semialdehyde dehydrogenase (acetylating)/methylmalonate-semialdehyde dehydrogenase
MNKPAELKLSTVPAWINGKAVVPEGSNAGRMGEIYNPATGQVTRRVPYCGAKVIDQAVQAAAAALPEWRDASILRRARVMQKFLVLLQSHQKELATLITQEHG